MCHFNESLLIEFICCFADDLLRQLVKGRLEVATLLDVGEVLAGRGRRLRRQARRAEMAHCDRQHGKSKARLPRSIAIVIGKLKTYRDLGSAFSYYTV